MEPRHGHRAGRHHDGQPDHRARRRRLRPVRDPGPGRHHARRGAGDQRARQRHPGDRRGPAGRRGRAGRGHLVPVHRRSLAQGLDDRPHPAGVLRGGHRPVPLLVHQHCYDHRERVLRRDRGGRHLRHSGLRGHRDGAGGHGPGVHRLRPQGVFSTPFLDTLRGREASRISAAAGGRRVRGGCSRRRPRLAWSPRRPGSTAIHRRSRGRSRCRRPTARRRAWPG